MGSWICVSITVHLGPRLATPFNPSFDSEVEQLRVDGLESFRFEKLDIALQRASLGRLGTRGNVTEGATAVRVSEGERQPSIGEAVKLLDEQCPQHQICGHTFAALAGADIWSHQICVHHGEDLIVRQLRERPDYFA